MQARPSQIFDKRVRLRAVVMVAALATAPLLAGGCGDDNTRGPGIQIDENGDVGSADAADGGGEADAGSPDVGGDLRRVPVRVETHLDETTVSAGTAVDVDCQLVDADDQPVDTPVDAQPRLVYTPEQSFEAGDGPLSIVPTVAGEATVACQFPHLSLTDDTPAELTIEAGQPFTVVTELDSAMVTAGEPAAATCQVFDAYGNAVDPATTAVEVDVTGGGINVDDHTVTITKSGIYTVTCTAEGASQQRGQALEVNPALPASLAIAKVPDRGFYDTGQVIEVATIVTDEYGNQIDDAFVSFQSNPAGNSFGHGRFRYDQDGTYQVSATVEGPTKDDMPLSGSVQIQVNGTGPTIECVSPTNGEMRQAAAGDEVTFTGHVADVQGVDTVTVNDTTVEVDADGNFQTDITTRFGINFVDIDASDAAGPEYQQQNSTTCAFLTSNKWADEQGLLADAVSLWLGQTAVDDGDHSDPLDSLNDVLHTVLNSQGLYNQLDSALTEANPLKSDCVVSLPFVGCTLGYTLKYRDVHFNGDRETNLTLIDDGMHLQAVINDLELDIDETRHNISGSVAVDQLTGELDVTLELQNGRPHIEIRPGTIEVTSGEVDVHIDSTIINALASIVESLFQDRLRGIIEEQIEGFLKTKLQAVLDNVVSGLDISTLGDSFGVPRLDGTGSVDLDFGVNFSSLSVDPDRALFGLGTSFGVDPVDRATPSLGVALPDGDLLYAQDPQRPISAAIHIGTLNYVLHTLWRGGLFDAVIDSSAIGTTFPEGSQIEVTTALPPVATLQGSDKVNLMIGAMRMSIVYPGIFDEPVEVRVGAVGQSGVSLTGNTLNFRSISLRQDEFYLSPIGISLDADTRDVLESFLRDVLQSIIDTSLNNALPALPIPSFTLPASLSSYGLPAGQSLGIVGAQLGGTNRHFLLRGTFGVTP